jgi:hypothetical protein
MCRPSFGVCSAIPQAIMGGLGIGKPDKERTRDIGLDKSCEDRPLILLIDSCFALTRIRHAVSMDEHHHGRYFLTAAIFMRFLYCWSSTPLEHLCEKCQFGGLRCPRTYPDQCIGAQAEACCMRRSAPGEDRNVRHHHAGHWLWLLCAIRRLCNSLRSALRGMP